MNLAFFVPRQGGVISIFEQVARLVEAQTDDIIATVTPARPRLRCGVHAMSLCLRPTVSIEMDRVKYLTSLRGRRFVHRTPGKLREAEALTGVGLNVPALVPIEPDTVLDPAEWGPYVVVKPVFGRRGAYVHIQRTTRVRYQNPAELPPEHFGRRGMLAQRFIYTGPWPVSYRVVTYFGRVVAAIRFNGRRDLPPLEGPEKFSKTGGHSIVASAMGSSIDEINEPDILDIARRAHTAFEDVPSLGLDIVREAGTGKLFVLEANPYGRSWLLGSPFGLKIESEFGLDFESQFDALNVMTEASIDLARKKAH